MTINFIADRLGRRLIFYFLVVLLIPTGFSLAYNIQYSRQEILGAARLQALQLVRAKAAATESQLLDPAGDVLFLGQAPATRAFINAAPPAAVQGPELEQYLRNFLRHSSRSYRSVTILDRLGREVLTVAGAGGPPAAPRPAAAEPFNREYFSATLHLSFIRGGRAPVYISPVEPDPAGGRPTLRYCILLRTDQDHIAGVLVLQAELERIFAALAPDDPETRVCLLDETGRSLLDSGVAGAFSRECPHDAEKILTASHGTLLETADRPGWLQAFARIKPSGQSAIQWTLLYESPVAGLLDQIYGQQVVIIATAFFTLLVATLLALFFTGSIVAPIRALAGAAASLRQGQWDAPVPESDRRDEIGALMRAFGEMSRALAEAYRELEARMGELAASEAALRRSEEDLQITLRSIGDAVIATDTEGRVKRLNPVAEQLTGWSQAEACGLPVEEVFRIIDEESRLPLEDPVHRVLRERTIVGLTNHTVLLARDGQERPVADSAAPIRDATDRITGVVMVFRDQTRERRARQALQRAHDELEQRVLERTRELRESENNFRSLMDCAQGFAVFRVALDPAAPLGLRVVFASPSLRELLGGADPERIETWDEHFPPEDRQRFREHTAAVIASLPAATVPRQKEYRVLRAGESGWVRVISVPVTDERGVLSCYNGIVLDITSGKLAEEALVRSERLAAVGTLAGGIAHEFNNINVSVLGFAQLALSFPGLDPEQAGFLERIVKAALRAKNITRNLLTFSGVTQSQTVQSNLVTVAEESLAMVARELESGGIEVQRQLHPVSEIMMDAGQIGQVILNLMLNAQHAMLDRPIRRLVIETSEDNQWVQVKVSDTGCGIPADKLSQIFSPFYSTKGEYAQLGSPQARVKGTGLGLSVSHTIVAKHRGEIKVWSEVGVGSAFTVRLPRTRAPEPADRPVAAAVDAAPTRGRVLVLDDEPDTRDLLQLLLEQDGHSTVVMSDGAQALREVEQGVDLALVDLQMPRMAGVEFLRRLAELPLSRRPVVIIVSGRPLELIQEEVGEFTVFDIIQKPFELEHLKERIRAGLNQHQADLAAAPPPAS